MKIENEEFLPYKVGALLYIPATNESIADKIISGAICDLSSICLCLEDSIADGAVGGAENQLLITLEKIKESRISKEKLPLIFVRIRSPKHLETLYPKLGDKISVLTGFVLPKFDMSNANDYLKLFKRFDKDGNRLYAMPTLESGAVATLEKRVRSLARIKKTLDRHKKYILNVRVGGNDFSQIFGIRRKIDQNIYQSGIIRNILTDITSTFASDYVVSGPVWEYFGENNELEWQQGLIREQELDFLNGFIGKTAIHPSQIPVIRECLRVTRDDFNDALTILDWNDEKKGVGKSAGQKRMNEVKTHTKWATRVYIMGKIYGIREE
ncbi:MAG: HpcH/HpaI aldolase/citrate lyase family protein [Clostridia bacterium]|nr:HpcH/HpaI aldolase/citrate lyase family protein [Clostridia bacterium]